MIILNDETTNEDVLANMRHVHNARKFIKEKVKGDGTIGKRELYIPELEMTVYVKSGETDEDVRNKYLNRQVNNLLAKDDVSEYIPVKKATPVEPSVIEGDMV
jgi:hypothetical protein